MRQQNQDLQMDYDEKKSAYDSTALQLQTNMAKVEVEVKKMRDEIQSAETRLMRNQTYPTVDSINMRLTSRHERSLYNCV